jgi:hypothetical protein
MTREGEDSGLEYWSDKVRALFCIWWQAEGGF